MNGVIEFDLNENGFSECIVVCWLAGLVRLLDQSDGNLHNNRQFIEPLTIQGLLSPAFDFGWGFFSLFSAFVRFECSSQRLWSIEIFDLSFDLAQWCLVEFAIWPIHSKLSYSMHCTALPASQHSITEQYFNKHFSSTFAHTKINCNFILITSEVNEITVWLIKLDVLKLPKATVESVNEETCYVHSRVTVRLVAGSSSTISLISFIFGIEIIFTFISGWKINDGSFTSILSCHNLTKSPSCLHSQAHANRTVHTHTHTHTHNHIYTLTHTHTHTQCHPEKKL